MFFLGFPVYRFEHNNSVSIQVVSCCPSLCFFVCCLFTSSIYFQAAAAKDPDSAFFKRLDGFQPCEVNELKEGTHYFAVYGMPLYVTSSKIIHGKQVLA